MATDPRPPVIYLDNSDFSNMAARREARWVEIRSRLGEAVSHGAIDVRFSLVHMMEVVHVDDHAKQFSVPRSGVVAELCGRRCLASWHHLIVAEGLRLLRGDMRPSRPDALRDDGIWLPPMEDLTESLREELRGVFAALPQQFEDEITATGMPRAERRRAMSKVRKLVGDGRFPPSTAVVAMMRQHQDGAALKQAVAHWPLNDAFWESDKLLRTMTGELPPSEFAAEIQAAIIEPDVFTDFYFDKANRFGGYFDTVRKFGAVLKEETGNFREVVRRVAETEGQEVARREAERLFARDPFEKARRKLLDQAMDVGGAIVRAAGVTAEEWQAMTDGAKPGDLPSLDAVFEGALGIMRDAVLHRPDRKLRSSDGGDALHFAYLPYVDWFRCDGHTANFARPVAARYGTRVFQGMDELMEEVAKLPPVSS